MQARVAPRVALFSGRARAGGAGGPRRRRLPGGGGGGNGAACAAAASAAGGGFNNNNNNNTTFTTDFYGGGGGGGGGDGPRLRGAGLNATAGPSDASMGFADGKGTDGEVLVIILDVKGMTCGGCAAAVKRILESIGDVLSAEVNLQAETALVHVRGGARAPGEDGRRPGESVGERIASVLTNSGFESQCRKTSDSASGADENYDVADLMKGKQLER